MKLAGPSATPARPVGTEPGRLRVNLGIQQGAVTIRRAPGVPMKSGASGKALRKAVGRDKPKVIRSAGG